MNAPLRSTDTLPSTGLDILLIGPDKLCQPIAQAILSSNFDSPIDKDDMDLSLPHEFLDDFNHVLASALRTKHVRIVSHLPLPDATHDNTTDSTECGISNTTKIKYPRVDYIVFVISLIDATTISNFETSIRKHIHGDYIHLHRVSIVLLHAEFPNLYAPYPNNPDLVSVLANAGISSGKKRGRYSKLEDQNDTMKSNVLEYIERKLIPVLKCDIENTSGLMIVSRIINKYAKLGIRQDRTGNMKTVESEDNVSISPLFYSTLL